MQGMELLTAAANILKAAHRIMAFNRSSASEYESVSHYLDNNKPIHKRERSYIKHREDLVTLRPGREHAWLDRSIEGLLHMLHKPFPFVQVRALRSHATMFRIETD